MACGGTSGGAVRAVDTNILVRLITRDDARQVAVAEAFVARGAWVPHLRARRSDVGPDLG